jgi:hypothetical protein
MSLDRETTLHTALDAACELLDVINRPLRDETDERVFEAAIARIPDVLPRLRQALTAPEGRREGRSQ